MSTKNHHQNPFKITGQQTPNQLMNSATKPASFRAITSQQAPNLLTNPRTDEQRQAPEIRSLKKHHPSLNLKLVKMKLMDKKTSPMPITLSARNCFLRYSHRFLDYCQTTDF